MVVTTKNKLFNIFLVFLLVLGIFSAVMPNSFCTQNSVYADGEVSTWDGEYASASDDLFVETGTEDDPYLITTASQFTALKNLITWTDKQEKYNSNKVYYKLCVDIDLGYCSFDGIGTNGSRFQANFDGNNHSILNYKAGSQDTSQTTIALGIFNYITTGSVSNLKILYPRINKQITKAIDCGVLCGFAEKANIENITVIGDSSSTNLNLTTSTSTSNVIVGGVIGRIYESTVSNCSVGNFVFNVAVKLSTANKGTVCFGGIVGSVEQVSTLSNSFADGSNSCVVSESTYGIENYIGGLVGRLYNNSTIENCFSKFDGITLGIDGLAQNNYLGGICGMADFSTIKNSYSICSMFNEYAGSTNYIGGLIGYANRVESMIDEDGNRVRVFLSSSYVVVKEAQSTYQSDYVGMLIGYVANYEQYVDVVTIENSYCVNLSENTTLADYNISTQRYTSDDVITQELSSTDAQRLSNFKNFSTDIWSNDLSTPINEGYPILRGVGNELEPTVQNEFEIVIKQITIDENGTSDAGLLQTVVVERSSSASVNINVYDHYAISVSAKNGSVSFNFDKETGVLLLSNPTGEDEIIITQTKNSYEVKFSVVNTDGGSAEFMNGATGTLFHGTSVSIKINPASGYRFDETNGISLTGDCNVSFADGALTLSDVASNVTIEIEFQKTYTISVTTSIVGVGKVKFSGEEFGESIEQTFDEGSNVTLEQAIDTQYQDVYEFVGWKNQNDQIVSTNSTYEITNLSADTTLVAVYEKISYKITFVITEEVASAGNIVSLNDSTISSSKVISGFEYNENVKISVASDTGAYISVAKIDDTNIYENSSENAGNEKNFNITKNITITISFSAYKFAISLNSTNGSLLFEDGSYQKTITYYDTIGIVATPSDGYEYAGLSGDTSLLQYDENKSQDVVVIDLHNFISQNATTNISLSAVFNLKKFGVTVNFNTNGRVLINNLEIEAGTEYKYDYGSNLTLQFVANQNYYLNYVLLNDSNITSKLENGVYTLSNLTDNAVVDVDFGIKKFSLSITNDFADVTFTIKADGTVSTETYFDAGTQIEISPVLPIGYLFNGYYELDKKTLISGNSTFSFELFDDYQIYASVLAQVKLVQTAHGIISKNKLDSYFAYGTELALTVTPDLGYEFSKFNSGFETTVSGTFLVTKYEEISAEFVSKTVDVVVSADENGKIKTNVSGKYVIGDIISIEVSAKTKGYHFAGYSGTYTGELEDEEVATYTILAQDAENGKVEIVAHFELDVFDVLITSTGNGTVTPIGRETYDYGTVLKITIAPDEFYQMKEVTVNDSSGDPYLNNYDMTLVVDADYTINVVFTPIMWSEHTKKPAGNGTSVDPYVITNANELAFITYAINSGLKAPTGMLAYNKSYYKLACDIDLSGAFYEPIGTASNPFNGTFDFNYFKVSNLMLLDDVSQYDYGGLFDNIGANGKIINQFKKSYLLYYVLGGSALVVLLVVLAVVIEKQRRKPKKVIILPRSLMK